MGRLWFYCRWSAGPHSWENPHVNNSKAFLLGLPGSPERGFPISCLEDDCLAAVSWSLREGRGLGGADAHVSVCGQSPITPLSGSVSLSNLGRIMLLSHRAGVRMK